MTDLTETATFTSGIYQLESGDPVQGGAGGIDNRQAQQLANRTAYLKKRTDMLQPAIEAAGLTFDANDPGMLAAALAALAGAHGQQLFTSNGTFTVPPNVYSLDVETWGAGGGASGGIGGSGGGGGYSCKRIAVTPGDTIAVTRGAGGTAGTNGGAAGNGGSSAFGSFCSATGGTGAGAGPGVAGTGSGGDINTTGEPGVDLDGSASYARGGLPPAWIGYGHGGDASAGTALGLAGANGAVRVKW